MVVGPTPQLAPQRLEFVYEFRIERIDFLDCLAQLYFPQLNDDAAAD
jgi:hypothetical protein